MAVTQGFVQRLTWFTGPSACVWVGDDEMRSELLILNPPESGDTGMGDALIEAIMGGCQVSVIHPDDAGTIEGVETPAPDPTSQPLQMDAVEVTQAVQDLSQSIPLVAGKRTVVRVYLSNHGSAPVTISGELAVRTSPTGPETIHLSENVVTLNPADAGNVDLARSDASRTLNFVLADPDPGQLAVRVNRLTDTVAGTTLRFGGERRPVVHFHTGAPLRVRVLGFTYLWGTPPGTISPTDRDYRLLFSWLGRAYPAARVLGSQAVTEASQTPPFGCGDINAQLAAIRALDVNAGTDPRTHYYGIVSDVGFFMRGCAAGIPSVPDPAVVACGPTGTNTWGWDDDGSYGDWYGGHELGHTLGRLHPGFCGESQDDLENYPFPAGQLSGTDSGLAGFDVGDPANGIAMRALPGTQWHDVMTYCDRQWLSVYTYLGIRERLRLEDDPPATRMPSMAGHAAAGRPTVTTGIPDRRRSMTGGRPDQRRFPDPGRPDQRIFPTREQGAETDEGLGAQTVSIVAQVNLTTGRGRIAYVNAVPNLSPTPGPAPSPTAGQAALRLTDSTGRVLVEHPVAVKLNSELAPDDDRTGIVDVVIAAGPDTAAIELIVEGDPVDTLRVGGPPPAVRAVDVNPTAEDGLRVSVDVDRPPVPGQTFAVQVSEDGGETWQTLGVGLRQPPFHLPRPAERHVDLTFRVIATNGLTSSTATSRPIRLR